MLLDTSGLLCCFDASDARHAQSIQFYEAASKRLTHNYILAEFIALTQARRYPRQISLDFAASLIADADIEIVWIDSETHHEAFDILRSQLDKNYSLCDAVSFVLMKRNGLCDALTTDRHFEQAGFQRLLPF